jgi:predicted esterase
MKFTAAKILLVTCILFAFANAFSQSKFPVLSLQDNSGTGLKQIKDNASINADSTYRLLSGWSHYQPIEKTGIEYIYYYTDSLFGKVPLRIYIPSSYKNTEKSGCILIPHGATGQGVFAGIDSLEIMDPAVIFATLKKQNCILVRPISDRDKHFDWAANKFGGRTGIAPNPTYKVLVNILISLKKILNIDDNKVFAFGHSDGSDGAISMAVYAPNQFAGVVAYNSMLNVIFGKDFYIRNIQNRPVYIVHSDLDDLRPIQQARVIINELTKIDSRLLYKEYMGYQHEDKHIDKDVPYATAFLNTESRNPYQNNVYWESNSHSPYNSCDWLKITSVDTTRNAPDWCQPLNFDTYNKKDKRWEKAWPYYFHLQKSGTVKASFNNNAFNIETSRVGEIELLISPVMVNLEEPVKVNINGKKVFEGKITADKTFLLNGFENTFDRQALWVNSIKLKVGN